MWNWVGWAMEIRNLRCLWLPLAMLLFLLLLLTHISHVRLCVTPQTAAHQAPLSMGFSRQECWSGLPFPSPLGSADLLNFLGFVDISFPEKRSHNLPPRFGAGKVQRAGSSCPESHLLCDSCHCSPVLKLFCRLWKQTLNCIVILQESIGEEPLSSQYSAWELLCASLVSWEI